MIAPALGLKKIHDALGTNSKHVAMMFLRFVVKEKLQKRWNSQRLILKCKVNDIANLAENFVNKLTYYCQPTLVCAWQTWLFQRCSHLFTAQLTARVRSDGCTYEQPIDILQNSTLTHSRDLGKCDAYFVDVLSAVLQDARCRVIFVALNFSSIVCLQTSTSKAERVWPHSTCSDALAVQCNDP